MISVSIKIRVSKILLPLTFFFFMLCFFTDSYCQLVRGEAQIFTQDGAWCWFQDPRAVYLKGKYERIYAMWTTHNGKLQAGSFDIKTGKIDVFTLKENWDQDDHNVGAFLILKDKRLMVFYAQHNMQGIFCRTTSQPEEITEWEDEVIVSNSDRITYVHPMYLSKEKKYYVFWRGPSWKPTFSTSRDGKVWSNPEILVQDSARESNSIRPYTKITSDGKSTIHITFTDGHPRVEPQNSVYYLKYEKGKFFKADGSVVGDIQNLPVRHSESDLVYDGKKSNVRAWVWDIAIDRKGNPVIVYTQLPHETDHRYHYVYWADNHWKDTELVAAGRWFPQTPPGTEEREVHYSGGITLDHGNPAIVYLSKQVNGNFEIERWETPDQGKSWNTQMITSNSKDLNVRPVIPVGLHAGEEYVLWMYGKYEHYTNYMTGIKLLKVKE